MQDAEAPTTAAPVEHDPTVQWVTALEQRRLIHEPYIVLESRPTGRPRFSCHPLSSTTRSHAVAPYARLWVHNSADSDPDGATLNRKARSARSRIGKLGEFLRTDRLHTGNLLFTDPQPSAPAYLHANIGDGRYFIHTSGADKLEKTLDRYERATLLTGVCLFGAQGFKALDPDGRRVDLFAAHRESADVEVRSLEFDDRLSFYEQESIVRLARCVADVLSVAPSSVTYTIHLDIPRVQYLFHSLELLASGRMSRALFMEWADRVRERHALLQGRVSDMLTERLEARGIRAGITTSDPMAVVEHAIIRGVAGRRIPSPAEIIDLLATDDPTWQRVREIASFDSYAECAYAPYVVEILRRALAAEGSTDEFVLAIENPMERKIFQQARDWFKLIRKRYPDPYVFNAVALYPHEMILGREVKGVPSLFRHDSPHGLEDDKGSPHAFGDLLERVYGVRCPTGLGASRFRAERERRTA